jgi:hypothetical protein
MLTLQEVVQAAIPRDLQFRADTQRRPSRFGDGDALEDTLTVALTGSADPRGPGMT